MKPYNQRKRRYSNAGVTVDPSLFTDLGNTGDYTELPADYYSSGSSSGSGSGSQFPWETLINTLGSLGTSIANIWSPAGNYTSQAWQAQYNQEKRTNTILWVVIGLVLALGVVLVIRKTK